MTEHFENALIFGRVNVVMMAVPREFPNL